MRINERWRLIFRWQERKSRRSGCRLPPQLKSKAMQPEPKPSEKLESPMGSAGLAEARERQRQEDHEADRFRGGAVRRDERAPVAGEGVGEVES